MELPLNSGREELTAVDDIEGVREVEILLLDDSREKLGTVTDVGEI